MWKDFFYFSRSERQGIIVLAVLIIIAGIAGWLIPPEDETPTNDPAKFEQEYTDFLSSVQERKQKVRKNYPSLHQKEVRLTPFDPNTADSIAFLNLGLPSWMAKNILQYRRKGGTFRKPDDFRKIYGLSADQYATLLPYMTISEEYGKKRKDTIQLLARQEKVDTLKFYKYPEGTVINLNRADTTELKKIPGIGSGIARMIVNYRKQLGMFYQIEQLQEINLIVEKLRPWLSVGYNETERININKASLERIMKHPYFNYYQAKVIVEYRKKKGVLKNIQQLSLYEEFKAEDFERLIHYVRMD